MGLAGEIIISGKLRFFGPGRTLLVLLTWICFTMAHAAGFSPLFTPLPALQAKDLAVIINDEDPLSVEIAKYYQKQRDIPEDQMIHINFRPGQRSMPAELFKVLKKLVDRKTPEHVQAYALTWIQPYRVGCMSITTAFAAGFDMSFCARKCTATQLNPYYNSTSSQPFADYSWRPSMIVAAENFADAKDLIDRGVASDYTRPRGKAYLLKTSDRARSTRAGAFSFIEKTFKGLWDVQFLEQDFIQHKQDIMFYFTGLAHVPKIITNDFLPGAVADHLTSAGGKLTGSRQMSIMEWIKGGATGSYGAVVEPCNFPKKFPNPGIMLHNYLRGSSLIETYWKSVAWPGQGVFVGEPLAKPFAWR